MSSFEWGIIIGGGLSLVGWAIALELRLRSLQNKLSEAELEKSDLEVQRRVHSLTDSDLNTNLSKDLRTDDK